MVDFHSHILPGIDDGSRNIEMSLQMLERSYADGIDTVVATSHCYLDRTTPEQFLAQREQSAAALLDAMKNSKQPLPRVVLGAEVFWCRNMSKLDNLNKLCISGTDYILVEMPYSDWTDEVFEEIYRIIKLGLKPIIAHLDRFFDKEKHFSELLSLDVLCQINAEGFFSKKERLKILELLHNDAAHIIGSDMHNLTSRPPNMAKVYEIVTKKFGKGYADFFQNNAQKILRGENVPPTELPSMGLIKKIMI